MKKLKSIIIFSAVLLAMAVLFCVSASAAEWKQIGEIYYSTDRDTGVTIIRGEGATVKTHMFGYYYCDEESCLVEHPDEADEPSERENDASVYTKTLIIESGVSLEMGALSPFRNAETIILPDDITVLPEGVCSGLNKLRTVVIPYGVTEIKEDAFAYCSSLKNISIPETVKTVGNYAFYNCDYNYVKIPDTVESVGDGNSLVPDCIDEINVTAHGRYVSLSWDRAKNATHYRIFIRENGKWKKVEDVKPDCWDDPVITGCVSNLQPYTEYTIAVRPYNKTYGKPTYWAPKYIKVTVRTTLDPIFSNTVSPKKGTAKITWDDIDHEQGYQIWYSTKEYSGYKKYSNFKANTTEAIVTGLTSGKKYYFKVRAYKRVNGKYIYSDFADVDTIKIK